MKRTFFYNPVLRTVEERRPQAAPVEPVEVTLTLDNTMLSDWKTCPRLFWLRHRRFLVPRKTSVALEFGAALHKGLDVYYSKDRNVLEAVMAFTKLFQQYEGLDDRRTLLKGAELLSAYHTAFAGEPWEDHGGELYFEVEIAPALNYCGIIDRIGRFQEEWTVHDFKSSTMPGAFVVRPNDQFTGYVMGAAAHLGEPFRNSLVSILGVYKTSVGGFLKGKKGEEPRSVIQRHLTPRSGTEIEEFLRNAVYWADQIREADRLKVYATNTVNCATKFGLCAYHLLCSVNCGAWETIIDLNYQVEKWDPGARELVAP